MLASRQFNAIHSMKAASQFYRESERAQLWQESARLHQNEMLGSLVQNSEVQES